MDMAVTFWLELCFSADTEVTERKSGGGKKTQASWARHMPLLKPLPPGKKEMQSRKGKGKQVTKSTNEQWTHNGYLETSFFFFPF